MRLKTKLTVEDAEIIGLKALTFLAEDEGRLAKFLAFTGLDPADLRSRAGEPSILQAVLEYLASDESLLLVFAAGANLPPEHIGTAVTLLEAAGSRG
jgi:Protein of unknown function (DUF3572).